MDKNTEREIAKGLRQGNRHAWRRLYEACAEDVWRNVSRLVGYDSGAAADIVQATFLAAARSARHFEPNRGSLRGWLWTIARRQVALYYRKQKPNISLQQAQNWWAALDGETSDWIDARADMPPDVLQSKELATLVQWALSELPAEYQSLLLAKYVDNQPAGHIAEQLACSEVAVRSKLARARKAFRKAFKKATAFTPRDREVSL